MDDTKWSGAEGLRHRSVPPDLGRVTDSQFARDIRLTLGIGLMFVAAPLIWLIMLRHDWKALKH
jgi:hypothetical protein